MNTGANGSGILESILKELQAIRQEVKVLRQEVSQSRSPGIIPATIAEETDLASEIPEEKSRIAAEDAFLSIFDWLSSRNITVKNYKQDELTDTIFNQLATFLGEKFASLERLHDQIRRTLSTGNSFTLNLSSSSQEEIANSTQLCTLLHKYAFLSSYRYNKYTKVIYAVPQRVGKVINFFTGGWFERFVFLKTKSLLSDLNLERIYLINSQISLPNGDDFELDILFLVENEPLWLECKTGDYQSYIKKYSNLRPTLSVSKERSILVVLGIPDELTVHLTELYDITVANENNFLSHVAAAMNLPITPQPAPPIVNIPANNLQSEKLLTLLNKAGLRPLPENRYGIIVQLIEIAQKMDTPKTLVEIKSLLAQKTNLSKSKLQDILNAIIRGGCLLDEENQVVLSYTTPFCKLVSTCVEEIEARCLASYAQAITTIEPTYFDTKEHIAEFKKITGGNIDPAKTGKYLTSQNNNGKAPSAL